MAFRWAVKASSLLGGMGGELLVLECLQLGPTFGDPAWIQAEVLISARAAVSTCAPGCQRHGMMSKVSHASQEIDSIIKGLRDWRGETLARLRASIRMASPSVVEDVKWKKPSNPAGVPVWSHDGIVCIGDALKNSVRLTFPKGVLIADPKKLFNARLDSKTTRAIDVREGETVDDAAFAALIRDAVRLNVSTVRGR